MRHLFQPDMFPNTLSALSSVRWGVEGEGGIIIMLKLISVCQVKCVLLDDKPLMLRGSKLEMPRTPYVYYTEEGNIVLSSDMMLLVVMCEEVH
jgi:hypothetical protein